MDFLDFFHERHDGQKTLTGIVFMTFLACFHILDA